MSEQHNNIYEKLGKMEGLLEAMHGTHELNREDIKEIKSQTIKTNGRVTKCEDFMTEQLKINSKLNGMFTKMFDAGEAKRTRDEDRIKNFWSQFFSKGMWVLLGILFWAIFRLDITPFL